MEIKKTLQNLNYSTCIEYTIKIPIEDVKSKEKYWKSKEKYWKIIHDNIDWNKEVLEKNSVYINLGIIFFRVYTRYKKSIEIEKDAKKRLENYDFHTDDVYMIDYEGDGWLRLYGLPIDKKTIYGLANIFLFSDWEHRHNEFGYLRIRLDKND